MQNMGENLTNSFGRSGQVLQDNDGMAPGFPEHWRNNFTDLSCHYLGADDDAHWLNIWINSSYGYETELLSHVCLNGSFAHLELEEWNKRCFPNIERNLWWRRSACVWLLFNFIIGLLGNLLTLVAIPYAGYKHRHVILQISNNIFVTK